MSILQCKVPSETSRDSPEQEKPAGKQLNAWLPVNGRRKLSEATVLTSDLNIYVTEKKSVTHLHLKQLNNRMDKREKS